MNWINGFELLCYGITLLFLVDVIRRKRREELLLFLSAALAGFALELLAVRVTDIYHYSKDFYINIGFRPWQFPFFGGLMWGGLTVYALRIARRFGLSPLWTALIGGWLIVTMDLFLDVAAIRLDGGFWVWDGRKINLQIDHHMFMSVIWVNFLGYLFQTPAMIYLSLRTEEKRSGLPLWKQLFSAVGLGAAGVAFVGAVSGISLLLNSITDEWFACAAFAVLWTAIFAVVLRTVLRGGLRLLPVREWDRALLVYWLAMYGFCAAAILHLGIAATHPAYFAVGITFGLGTMALGTTGKNGEPPKKKRKAMRVLCIAAAILLLALLIVFPPSTGKLPERGTSNGLSERTQVETDDGSLELLLLSDDVRNPVLLVCGGGPGIPQYLLEDSHFSPLPEVFTVCYWDYRGTGASFRSDTVSGDMTTERYIRDALAVTDYLARRFSNDKIYVMGHSFGTYLALKTVQAHPERYKCYIGMSQIVDQTRSEYLAFDWMKAQYEQNGDTKMAEKFGKYDIRGSAQDYDDYFFSGLRDEAMHDLGVGTTREMRSVISGIFFPSLRCTAYTQLERINIWRGKALSRDFPVTKDAIVFNAIRDVPKLEIPIVILAGKQDYTCCYSLQEEYFDAVDAPQKTFYRFENSAHSPIYEEYGEGLRILKKIRSSFP